MRRGLRWFGYALATIVALAIVAVAAVYVASDRNLARRYAARPEALVAPGSAARALLRARRGCSVVSPVTDAEIAALHAYLQARGMAQ